MRRIAIVLVALAAAGCGAASTDGDEAATVSTTSALSLAPTAVITCSPSGTSVATPEVAARRDGVHVELRNETGAERLVEVGSGAAAQAEPLPAGMHARVWPLPPGEAQVTCYDPAGDPGEEDAAAAAHLEIVDPDGVWVSTELPCDAVSTAQLDYVAGAAGLQGDPVEAVRADSADRLRPGDVVERAGYPDAEDPATVRIVRDGRVISVLALVRAEDGGWLVSTVSDCGDA